MVTEKPAQNPVYLVPTIALDALAMIMQSKLFTMQQMQRMVHHVAYRLVRNLDHMRKPSKHSCPHKYLSSDINKNSIELVIDLRNANLVSEVQVIYYSNYLFMQHKTERSRAKAKDILPNLEDLRQCEAEIGTYNL